MNDHAELARLMRSATVMLASAVNDVERGLWSVQEREPLAAALDKLSAALRGQPAAVVIEAERADR